MEGEKLYTILTEGLGSVLKNMVTGDIESEIDELEKEARDIHTPEQQRYVLTKIIRLLERLVVMRHNPSKMRRFIHDNISWFQDKIKSSNEVKVNTDMTTRIGQNIARLAKLRDMVLKKKWSDDKYNTHIDEMKERAARIVADAENKDAEF